MAAAKRGSREGAARSGALAVPGTITDALLEHGQPRHYFVAHPAGEGRCRRPGCNLPRESKIHLRPPPPDLA